MCLGRKIPMGFCVAVMVACRCRRHRSRSSSGIGLEGFPCSAGNECSGDGTDRKLERFAEAFWVDQNFLARLPFPLRKLTWCPRQ